MSKYTLLRNNRQYGPYTLDEIATMGLKSQDLIWLEGKSASWRYPAEIEELKSLVPKPVEKTYNHIPLTRTRLQNDFLLLRNDSKHTRSDKPLLSETEISEFPTLARFFMAEQYEKQKTASAEPAQLIQNEHRNVEVKKSVWVSMPSAVRGKTIVLINSRVEKVKKEQSPVSRLEESVQKPEMPSEEMVLTEELKHHSSEVPVIPMFEEASQQEPLTENFGNAPSFTVISPETEKTVPVIVSEAQISVVSPVYFRRRKDKRLYASSLLQNLAVAVAIASLLTVGGLIAYSVMNPGYPVIPTAVKSVQPSKKLAHNNSINASSQSMVNEAAYRPDSDQGPPAQDQNSASLTSGNTEMAGNNVQTKAKKTTDKKVGSPVAVNSLVIQENIPVTGETTNGATSSANEPVHTEEKKNIAELVDLKLDGYKVGFLGGVKEFDVVVQNNADVALDLVVVEVKYIQSNKKIYKTETLQFYDIAAQSHQSIEVPRSSRGVKVETQIKSISSREYGLGFNN